MEQQAPDNASPAPNGRVALRHKILYGVGYLSVALTADMTLTWILKRYRPDPTDERWEVLVTATAFALAMMLGRLMDALSDPVVGFWSDRIKTPWGRRKPFIIIGGPILALVFVLVWIPPTPAASLANGIHLAVTVSLFFLAFTIVVCPYLSMLPEMTADPQERVKLTAWQGVFNIIGVIGGTMLAGYLIEHYGYLRMGLFFAPIIWLCSWAPLLVPTPVAGAEPSPFSLTQAVVSTLRNPLFPPYVIAQLLFWIALRIIMGSVTKLVEIRAEVGEAQQGMVLAAGMIVAALLFPLTPALARRFGKKRLLRGAMVLFGLVMIPLNWLGYLPVPLAPIWQAVLVMALAGPAISALFTLPNAIVADIIDYDYRQTGQRREAIYYGVQGLIVKGGLGFGVGLAAILLQRFGETPDDQGGFTACALAAAVFCALAALVMGWYRGD